MREKNRFERSFDRLSDYSDDAILADLRRLSQQLGKTEVSIDDVDALGRCSYALIKKRFGGIRVALKAAGIDAKAFKRNPTQDELLSDLSLVWERCLAEKGRRPFRSDLRTYGANYSGNTYERHFGSWIRACEALLKWDGQMPMHTEVATVQAAKPVFQTKKPIPLRIRYAILVRDRFTCRICGKAPSTHPGTALHIDHIIPESRGGTLDESNLRCLCGDCNIGKGAVSEEFENTD